MLIYHNRYYEVNCFFIRGSRIYNSLEGEVRCPKINIVVMQSDKSCFCYSGFTWRANIKLNTVYGTRDRGDNLI